MRDSRICFIAETDVDGAVLWVWRFGPGDVVAKPAERRGNHAPEIANAEFVGATREDIRRWFEADETRSV